MQVLRHANAFNYGMMELLQTKFCPADSLWLINGEYVTRLVVFAGFRAVVTDGVYLATQRLWSTDGLSSLR